MGEPLYWGCPEWAQAINESTGHNFYDYINSFRVEAVKENLKNPDMRESNILHLAFDAGFNSKSTFNNVSRKYASLTPTEYKKFLRRLKIVRLYL